VAADRLSPAAQFAVLDIEHVIADLKTARAPRA
jgi:hypothetical protein